jgi:hypothetical protein
VELLVIYAQVNVLLAVDLLLHVHNVALIEILLRFALAIMDTGIMVEPVIPVARLVRNVLDLQQHVRHALLLKF